ncbi:MAG: heme exporter protein CcmD [Rhodoplanes sp.]|jgi:heme exporter protein D
MGLGVHAYFIIASYGVAFAIIAGLIAWVAVDYRRQRCILADLERRGVTRRSANIRPTPIEGTA